MAGQAETPTVMPMKLIASWDMERSNGATCVPRFVNAEWGLESTVLVCQSPLLTLVVFLGCAH